MPELVFLMELRIVAGARLPHFPKDFQPTLAQAPQGAGVRFAPLSKALVIGFGPRAGGTAQVSPEVKGMAEHFVAMATKPDLMNGAGLVALPGRFRHNIAKA